MFGGWVGRVRVSLLKGGWDEGGGLGWAGWVNPCFLAVVVVVVLFDVV